MRYSGAEQNTGKHRVLHLNKRKTHVTISYHKNVHQYIVLET